MTITSIIISLIIVIILAGSLYYMTKVMMEMTETLGTLQERITKLENK
jgi:hypothetical protein